MATHEELRAQAIAELEPQIAEMIVVKQTAMKGAAEQRVSELEAQLQAARDEAASFQTETPVEETSEVTEPQG